MRGEMEDLSLFCICLGVVVGVIDRKAQHSGRTWVWVQNQRDAYILPFDYLIFPSFPLPSYEFNALNAHLVSPRTASI